MSEISAVLSLLVCGLVAWGLWVISPIVAVLFFALMAGIIEHMEDEEKTKRERGY
jgi:hypothetical protein